MTLQPTPKHALPSKHNIAFENAKYNVYSYLKQKADTCISMSAKASSLACGSLHGGRGQESHNLFPVLAHENSEVRSGHVADVEPQQVPHLSLNVTGFGQVPELVFSKATHRTLRGIGQVLNRDIYSRKRARNHAHTSSTASCWRSLTDRPLDSSLRNNQSPLLRRGFLYRPVSSEVQTVKVGPSERTLTITPLVPQVPCKSLRVKEYRLVIPTPQVPVPLLPALEPPVGITKTLVSFKASEPNLRFIDELRARLANRVSRSLIVEELVTVCRVLYSTHELTFTPEDPQGILSINSLTVDVGNYPVLAFIPDLSELCERQMQFQFAD